MAGKKEFQIIFIVTLCSSVAVGASTKSFYRAAIFEHARKEDDSRTGFKTNLEFYKRATEEARRQEAEIIVFPEYGIFPPGDRQKIRKYVEAIPNPYESLVVPCNETYQQESPILYTLSCMAKNNQIIVVANLGGIEKCGDEYKNCPTDGNLHMNADVAFDKNGTLIGRYYKEHLYYESGMDLPKEKQNPIFKTDIGKFAMFICFEIIFKKMADVSRLPDIDAILFSTLWMNSSPFFTGTQWFQAWAMGNNATVLAANLNIPGHFAAGSGIFNGRAGEIVSTFNPDGISKLVIANVPKRNMPAVAPSSKIFAITQNDTLPYNEFEDLPLICEYMVLGLASNHSDYRCITEDLSNYTLIKLDNSEDHLEVCSNGMCCELDYSAVDMKEDFFFGVFNGTHIPYLRYPWAEENCFLARCNGFNGSACANIPMKSETVFTKISIRANFTTKYVYPSMVNSNMRLVPINDWSYSVKDNKRVVKFNKNPGSKILLATLKGRAYKRDPPYVR